MVDDARRPANFRDVGAALRGLGCCALRDRILLRGGSVDHMTRTQLGEPGAIISVLCALRQTRLSAARL